MGKHIEQSVDTNGSSLTDIPTASFRHDTIILNGDALVLVGIINDAT